MATPISAIIKQCFTMMPTLKLDNKLVHRTTSIIIQKPRLEIQIKATLAIMATMEILAIMTTPIMAIIKQFFTMMPTLKLDNNLARQITSIITLMLRLVHQEEDLHVRHNLHFVLFVPLIFYQVLMTQN